jgi:hypothetical protein
VIALALRALQRRWPQLLAWFVAGWAVRLMLLRFAGWAAENVDPLVGQLILPLAVLARLASFVAMFLVLRPELSHYERLEEYADKQTPGPDPSFVTSWLNTVGAAIVPFFVIYAAWGLINDDSIAYSHAALDQLNLEMDGTPLDTPFSWQTIAIVLGAFALRRVIAHFAARLPRWFGIIAVYLEAVWVFIAVSFIRDLLAGVPDWFATRRMFAGIVDGWAALRESVPALQWVTDAWAWLLAQLGDAVFQPFAWLALAAIVLAGALPLVSRRRRRSRLDAARDSATRRWLAVGSRTRRILMWPVNGFLERWQPIATAFRLIWRAGPVVMGTYVIAFGVLTIGTQWVEVLIQRAIGPHETGFWIAWEQPLALLIDVVLYVPQIALVAAAFDRCLRALDTRVSAPSEELAQVETPRP